MQYANRKSQSTLHVKIKEQLKLSSPDLYSIRSTHLKKIKKVNEIYTSRLNNLLTFFL